MTGVRQRPNHRDSTRYTSEHLRVQGGVGGRVLDLSTTGARIVMPTKQALKPGQRQRFEFDSGSQALRLTGEVVWRRKPDRSQKPCHFGIRFVNPAPAVGAMLEHWVLYGYLPKSVSATAYDKRADLNDPCLYGVLGVTPEACQAEIHAAYRALAKVHHPDISASPDAPERFDRISKVYRVLGDALARKRYDESVAARTRALIAA